MVKPNNQPSLFEQYEPKISPFDVDEAVRMIGENASQPHKKWLVDQAYNRDAVREGLLENIHAQDALVDETIPVEPVSALEPSVEESIQAARDKIQAAEDANNGLPFGEPIKLNGTTPRFVHRHDVGDK